MRKVTLVLALILVVLIVQGQENTNNFDFSGMDIFWEIVSYLEKDQEAHDELWEKLNNHPGYKTAIKREFGKRYFKSFYEMAFMPSKIEERDQRIARGGFFGPYLEHMVSIKKYETELKELQQKLSESPELYNMALNRCKEYLPEGVFENNEKPVVSFIVFGPDGRGYEPILVDPLYFITEVYDQTNFLAHEFHHHYVDNYSIFRDGEEILNWIFDQVYKEGIADLINIPEEIFVDTLNNSKRAVKYRKLFAQSEEMIRNVDSLLSIMYHNDDEFYKHAKQVRDNIPMAGHTLGYFMTSNIVKYNGKEEIIKDFGNPYRFLVRYNHVAKQNDLPCFSENSMKLFEELELRYNYRKNL